MSNDFAASIPGTILSEIGKFSFVICFTVVFVMMMIILAVITDMVEKMDAFDEAETRKRFSRHEHL